MSRNYSMYGKKKSAFLNVVIGMTIISGLATGVLSVGTVMMNINIHRSEQSIKEINSNIVSMENELSNIKEQEDEYKNQAEVLQQQLSQYQPVVIPDSMKTEKVK